MTSTDPSRLTTVSALFADDWVAALRRCCDEEQLESFLRRAGLNATYGQLTHRVTLDQIVRLYQIAAIETGDEMMGLWSRPIRARALQHLLTTVREASSPPSALHRFSTFWNLLLDDFQFELAPAGQDLSLRLVPQGDQEVQRFGHMLILKLAHGLLSWIAGYEKPVHSVDFAFERPEFSEDYAAIFPAPVRFAAQCSGIVFSPEKFRAPVPRSDADLKAFLDRAPRDWIFTGYHQHSQSRRVRDFLFQTQWANCHLTDAALALNITPRTLMRRLDAEDTTFQAIKDGLRRDLAISALQSGAKSIEEISQDVGFSSAANFHRAFQRWTGAPPSAYRISKL